MSDTENLLPVAVPLHRWKMSTFGTAVNCLNCGITGSGHDDEDPCDSDKGVLSVISANRTRWNVTVKEITRYGRTVNFYDALHAGEHNFPELGQMVAYYDVTTMLAVDGGLNLHGGEPAWWIDAETMWAISEWVAREEHNNYVADMSDEDEEG